ncbi:MULTISPECIES: excalibur calcium-binding domain-containing protein [unclassified Lysinibacillus]|uniref:excalibur calcium-binding domain-containing protein n=2 Tax=unclassified Lysinibacillus TaxID=2636778 RepID=UPI002010FB8C|nr:MULTISPECIES: excalibur calcium-binding domain-containing protein [unclassified Lysinibacillus]MCL1694748.1 excalibur calcium-binding domain-containing protein [Lysinibacillus sp. BPa_S21]MCL1699601.1 excalibur calcium-binding domain-containing protein [Lysinibacillus sp. Bpr_S20]
MKKLATTIIASSLLIGVTMSNPTPIEAAAKSYKNCAELNKDYKGGVAKDANVKNKGGKTKYKPFVSAELYKANITKDRDKDGIACER